MFENDYIVTNVEDWTVNEPLRDFFYAHVFSAIMRWNHTHPPTQQVLVHKVHTDHARATIRAESKEIFDEFMKMAIEQFKRDYQKFKMSVNSFPATESAQVAILEKMLDAQPGTRAVPATPQLDPP